MIKTPKIEDFKVEVNGKQYDILVHRTENEKSCVDNFSTYIDGEKYFFQAKAESELYTDLCSIMGSDANKELANILTSELKAEIQQYLQNKQMLP